MTGGEWFSREGVRRAIGDGQEAIQAVLGEGIARELGRDRQPEELATAKNRERLEVGETFPLGGRTWIVVGVIRSSGSTFDSEIWAKRDHRRQACSASRTTRRSSSARPMPRRRTKLKNFFNNDYEKAAVQAYTRDRVLRQPVARRTSSF